MKSRLISILLLLLLLLGSTLYAQNYRVGEPLFFRIPHGNTLPATCVIGDLYKDDDATSGQQLYACESADTWVKQGDGGGVGGGISNVVEDTTPQLGGNLDLNSFAVGAATAADLTKLNAVTATAAELNYIDGATSDIQTQLNGKAALLAAGSDGTALTNAGDDTTAARSDHEHLVPWQVGAVYQSTPATGVDTAPLPANNQCGGSIAAKSVSITALVKGTALTFNINRYSAAGSLVGALFSSTQTFNTAGNTRQDFTPNQNATGITSTDYFLVNFVTITGTNNFSAIVQGTCKNL